MAAGQLSEQQILPHALPDVRPIFQSLAAVGMVLLVYDYLLTFDLEIEFIWKSRWNAVKVLFLLTRYLPFLELLPLINYVFMDGEWWYQCETTYRAIGWMQVIGVICAEVRIWAVWDRSRRVGIFLTLFALVSFGLLMGLANIYFQSVRYFKLPQPHGHHCLSIRVGNNLYIVSLWVIILIYDTVLISLLVVRGIPCLRAALNCFRLQNAVFRYVMNVVIMLLLPFEYINILAT
ncbi:hypothetical protein CC1G_06648 [Coprinopsis cinerea okayama7|uniref:DUF6533 domain-containing protein n=1 Tax=Coprinopsis cinerea (strain Okayama-7 / 130 / ATCC MYA-4618 / FGSC 9003) TaxID=240176 RepID=A8P7V5_COPC7|nr:hypothetical protein CC1G_06648 [Coprinopsis cinerea okayama7\|eukprot:XP_001839435.2 hypothetical protein CC1G_06648 [Coprinopsis cinerea okayama7\